ncbi:MAG: carboxypeptidase-like regulatory domain-containing protein, partial [Cyclobacteriaceae bacterium]|nr:carboxypeptidase-like regulatory domain-containing protein [Cyclobacteriaceae bacterium]
MKNTIKILKTIILSIVTSAFSLGQSTINGQIKENDNPVSFANVLLLNPTDSSLVKGAVTDSEGNFKIEIRKAGNYMVKTTSIGYKTEFSTIQVSSNDKNIDLG